MELGGGDAFVVLDNADMETAVKWSVWGRMDNMGQSCAGAKRFILDDKIADVFLSRFARALRTRSSRSRLPLTAVPRF